MKILNIDLEKNMEKIINGVNLLRLGNNPVDIDGSDITNILINDSTQNLLYYQYSIRKVRKIKY